MKKNSFNNEDASEEQPCTSSFSSPTIDIPKQPEKIFSDSFDKASNKLHYFQKHEGNSIFYADSNSIILNESIEKSQLVADLDQCIHKAITSEPM